MDKLVLAGMFVGFIVGAIVMTWYQEVEADRTGIPPTPSFAIVGIDNNVTLTNSTQTNVTAVSYKDDFYLITDGSIILNITEYP